MSIVGGCDNVLRTYERSEREKGYAVVIGDCPNPDEVFFDPMDIK